MSQEVSCILLLLLHTTQSWPETYANCYEDVPVMCPGVDINITEYTSVAWYKVHNQQKLGIVRKGKDDGTMQYYNFSRSLKPRFGERHSLLLPRVTPEDSGTYECEISANIGGQNQNLKVELRVHECVTQADPTTMTTVLNMTHPDQLCHKQMKDLPVKWSIIGYVVVGFAKIILSLISIWVIQTVRSRSARRRQNKW